MGRASQREREARSNRPTSLITARLMLREFAPGDLTPVERLVNHPRVREHSPLESRVLDVVRATSSRSTTADAAARTNRTERDEILAVVVRRTGKLIGACDLTRLSRRRADIGYMLTPRHWGHGYGTELVEALLTHAFLTLGLARITAVVAIDNERSRRVLARNGFQWQELIRSYLRSGGRSWDCHRYAIDQQEWRRLTTHAAPISRQCARAGASSPPGRCSRSTVHRG